MSALDQAFIKAYAKDAPAPADSGAPAAPLRANATVGASIVMSSAAASIPAAHIENLYADGALYRLEVPLIGAEPQVPAPHYTPPASQHRTTQRRVAARYRQIVEPPMEADRSAPPPAAPARRMTTHGLSEVVRRLAHYLPPAPASELPPEVLIVDEPHVDPVAPAVNAAPAVERKPAQLPEPPAPKPLPRKSVTTETRVAQPPANPMGGTTSPAEDVATLVEVCTPWEPINDAVTGSMVILSDAPELSATSLSAMVDVALDPMMERRLGGREPSQHSDEITFASEPRAKVTNAAAPVETDEPKKIHRIDPPLPQAVGTPHFPLTHPVGSESPTMQAGAPSASEPAPSLSLAELTPEETASLMGTLPDEPTTAQVPPTAAPLAVPATPLVPMWEVDRFQWPSLCDRLMKDEQSYFAQAGGKLVAAAKDGLKTLGITGSRRGEGRTTLALCLARCAAQSGLNVAMIDADFTRPQLAAVMGLEVAYGWQDAALGKIPLAEAAVKSLSDTITVLPLEASSVAWPLALADKRVAAMIRAVAQSHDLVIVDLGPLASGGEPVFAIDEAAPLDAVIVLRDLRYATPSETQAIGERLHASGVEAIGIAENFVPAEKAAAR